MLHVHNSKNAYNTLDPDRIIPIDEKEALKVIENGGLIACAECRLTLSPENEAFNGDWLDCYCRHCPDVHLKHLEQVKDSGFLKHYQTDLDIDRWLLSKHPDDEYIHIIRNSGTHIFDIRNELIINGFLNAWCANTDIKLYHFDGKKWWKITYKQMMRLCR